MSARRNPSVIELLALLGRMIGRSLLTPLPCCKTSLCTYGDSKATCTHMLSELSSVVIDACKADADTRQIGLLAVCVWQCICNEDAVLGHCLSSEVTCSEVSLLLPSRLSVHVIR